jgi:hypothetical protein
MAGEIRISLRERGDEDVGMVVVAACVTGNRAPFPTVMDAGKETGLEVGKLPGVLDIWEEVPVSMYHSLALGGSWLYVPAEDRVESRAE